MLSKQNIYNACTSIIEEKLEELNLNMQNLKESIAGEEKSSAGDKFETARAMAQKEMEQLNFQILKQQQDYKILLNIDINQKFDHIQLGSLVKTKSKRLFIAVAIGRIHIDNTDVFVISPSSPIGQLLIGQEQGYKFTMAGKSDEVLELS
ncbi:MAG: hypothetical protein JXR19_11340 [Bacteroidia bacterium]